jgi:hypothetical protein
MAFIVKREPTPSTLLNGLLAYWKLNTTSWLDSSGNGNTLSVANGPSSNITIESGKITNASRFNYNGTYLRKIDFSLPNSWTISFWVKIVTDNSIGEFPNFSVSGTNSGTIVAVVEFDSNSKSGGWIYSSDPANNYGQFYEWSYGSWYHICITQDSSGLNWYINNSLYITDEGEGSARSGVGLEIGANSGGDNAQGDYSICEYGVWNRALTALEITSLYNAGAGKTYPF